MCRYKNILYFIVPLLLNSFSTSAQSLSVSISGGNCIGNTLTLSSSIKPAMIIWKFKGKAVDTVYATWNRRAVTVAGSSSGVSGSSSSLLDFPFGLFVTDNDTIYLADYHNNRIQKWAPGGSSGVTIAGTGLAGTADSELYEPANIFLDTSKNIFVDDYFNSRIQKFTPGSKHATTVAGTCCTTGGSTSMLDFPTSIYVDKGDTVFVCDGSNYRIMKWAPGATSGALVAGGGSGSSSAYLNVPLGVFLDTFKNIYIADNYNNRIQRWAPGASFGQTVDGSKLCIGGIADTLLSDPSGVFLDVYGNLYIADAGNNRIELLHNGKIICVNIAGSYIGSSGATDSLLNGPSNIFLDGVGNLFVADANNNRVQKFSDTISMSFTTDSVGVYTATVYTFKGATATDSITIYPIDTPMVNITAYPGDTICMGTPTKFVASFSHMSTGPTYQWKRNGINVGTNDSSYSPVSILTGDSITCVISSGNPCAVTHTASSNKIVMVVEPDTTPTISINGNTSGPIGSTIHLFATIRHAVAGYKINWIKNGLLFATTTTPYVTYIKSNTTDSITATIVPTTGCYNTVTSNNWFVEVGVYVPMEESKNEIIRIYPNPFIGPITISALKQGDRISLFDILGQKLNIEFIATKDGENKFDLNNVPAGLYTVRVFDKNGKKKTNLLLQKE